MQVKQRILIIVLVCFWLLKLAEELTAIIFYKSISTVFHKNISESDALLRQSILTPDEVNQKVVSDLELLENGFNICRMNASMQPYLSILILLITIAFFVSLTHQNKRRESLGPCRI